MGNENGRPAAASSADSGDTKNSVTVRKRGWLRRLFAFVGPAYLVSVGYMDPGNWATDIEGGARFGYTLIWVLLMSNIMAVLLQALAARLGIVTGYDLAQGCRREYPRPVAIFLWLSAEVAIIATDLAEAIGTILGLNMLFGLPLLWGCAVTAFDTLLLLVMLRLGIRKMEAFIVLLIVTIGACFFIEVFIAEPDWGGIAAGFVPHLEPGALYIAIGIIGATVMPHNLYLHSSLVQSRHVSNTYTGKAEACRFNLIDSTVAMNLAFFVNAAILVMAAANFHSRGIVVTEIQQAHELLNGVLGSQIAPLAFAIALLAAGQSSTITGTISGQIIMEGFLNLRIRPWLRRAVTRGLALGPAVVVIALTGSEGIYKMLILSQVVLSLQLPFAVIPLIHFTADKRKMGLFANKTWVNAAAWVTAAIIVALNLKLVVDTMGDSLADGPIWLWLAVAACVVGVLAVLAFITFGPLLGGHREWETGITTSAQRVAQRLQPMKIDHVGVALEHAAGDSQVISAALSLAHQHTARITLIHVVETPGGSVFGDASDSLHSRADEAYLDDLVRETEDIDLAVESALLFGKPSDEIIKAVDLLGLDIIVLGSHGHKGMADVIFGETISKVRHAVPIPVFIVPLTDRTVERPHTDPSAGAPPA